MIPDLPVRIMAFIGMTVAGAFLLGWGAQMLSRMTFNQKVPPWPLWGVRVLGAVLFGMLAWVWLFGGGGTGLGGGGGYNLFGGKGKVAKDDKDAKDEDKGKGKGKKEGVGEVPVPGDTLRVEVLGDEALRKVAGGKGFDAARRYRVAAEGGLRTLDEVQKLVLKRRGQTTPLRRLEVVIYLDSPARDRPQVAELVGWARDLNGEAGRLRVDFIEPDRPAPAN
jgi:hypothetical protein